VTPDIAKKILVGDIGTLKGTSTRHIPKPAKEDLAEIPPELLEEHQDLTYCMDMVYVNGMPIMTGIDQSIWCRGLVPLTS
jgi:hypothetical protein